MLEEKNQGVQRQDKWKTKAMSVKEIILCELVLKLFVYFPYLENRLCLYKGLCKTKKKEWTCRLVIFSFVQAKTDECSTLQSD